MTAPAASGPPELLTVEEQRRIVLMALYAANKDGREGVHEDELMSILNWCRATRALAGMIDGVTNYDIMIRLTADGECSFELTDRGKAAAEALVKESLG